MTVKKPPSKVAKGARRGHAATASSVVSRPGRRRAAPPDPTEGMTEAEAADYYNRTRDLSGFEGGEVVELESPSPGTRSVTLSIRLSPEELQTMGQRAEAAGMKVTAYIRGAALQAEAPPIDDDLAEVVDMAAALHANLEAARARREATIHTAPTGSDQQALQVPKDRFDLT
jgi:hypothetical protein